MEFANGGQNWLRFLSASPATLTVQLNSEETASSGGESSEQSADAGSLWSQKYIQIICIYLVLQAIVGVCAIEYAFSRTKRFREVNEGRDGQYPCFRRYDARKWARWKFYPGAMFLMPTRLILLCIDGLFLTTFVSIFTIGHNFKKGPMKNGCRKWILYFMYHVCCSFFLFVVGIHTTVKHIDYDYEEYLGENYKKNFKKIKRTSTIVSNHVSWLDPIIYIKNVRPAFAPSAEFRNVPLLATLIDVIDSIYIPRGGTEEMKAKALAAIKGRQEMIEDTGRYAPFLIFVEGGTSNGTGLIKFKKGAFFSEKTVKPMFLKYSDGTVSPAFDTMEFLPLAILTLCWYCFKCEVNVMPDFQPNEYLFETHQEKGQERWEIYAWAVRDAMMKAGNFKACDIPLRQKIIYEAFMQRKKGAPEPALVTSTSQWDSPSAQAKMGERASQCQSLLAGATQQSPSNEVSPKTQAAKNRQQMKHYHSGMSSSNYCQPDQWLQSNKNGHENINTQNYALNVENSLAPDDSEHLQFDHSNSHAGRQSDNPYLKFMVNSDIENPEISRSYSVHSADWNQEKRECGCMADAPHLPFCNGNFSELSSEYEKYLKKQSSGQFASQAQRRESQISRVRRSFSIKIPIIPSEPGNEDDLV